MKIIDAFFNFHNLLNMSLIEGYLIGLAMIIFIGPVFFLLLNSSLQYGFNAGVATALGIIVSDIVCVLLCYYGVSSFFNASENQLWIGIVGSLILFGLGIHYLFKEKINAGKAFIGKGGFFTFFIKGFSVNFFNPFVFVVWIGVFQYGTSKYPDAMILFLISVLAGIFTIDILKVLFANRIKRLIVPKKLAVFFKVTGVILIGFAIRLLYLVLYVN